MDRTRTVLVNFVLNFLVGYALAALLKGRRAALGVGVLAGAAGAVVGWFGAERPELFESEDDEPEPVEIEL